METYDTGIEYVLKKFNMSECVSFEIAKLLKEKLNMTYVEFANNPPGTLYGTIMVNDKQKIGSFRTERNKHSNRLEYRYYTENGNKGTGGFTLMKAYRLYIKGTLSTNPEMGKKENYV